jgi:HEAT repeat protein
MDGDAEGERTTAIVTDLLASPDPEFRAAGADAVAQGATLGVPLASLIALAGDPVPHVRAGALRALPVLAAAQSPADTPAQDVTELLLRGLVDDDVGVRRAAAMAVAGRPGAASRVVEILEHGPTEAQGSALHALADLSGSPGERVVAWAEREADRAIADLRDAALLRRPVAPAPSPGAAEATAWLAELLERKRATTVHRLLTLLSVTGAPEAGKSIRRSLASRDPETRAQAIEALDAVGDRRLRRVAVRLIEDASDGAPDDPIAVARRLSADRDPWVRGLALRTLAERLRAEWLQVAGLASADPDPIVRVFAIHDAEPANAHVAGRRAVPETQSTIGDLDRMLFLRHVPLFGELEPQDLQRIAAAATERRYEAGDEMLREGDVGDELLLLVEGSVRVVRHDGPGGAERLIRTYAAGAHIGELAVLREGTRAATVIAQEPGVRALVLGGEALRSILAERPAAAMAMLATLADRISSQ